MNRALIAFVMIVIFSGSGVASAQTFVESQHKFTGDDHYTPTLDGQFLFKDRSNDWAFWWLATDGWGEVLAGPAKSIKPWLWASFLVGVETDNHVWRVNPNVWVGKGRFSSFHAYEWGGSGFWYKSTASVALGKRVRLGIHSQRFYGNGPLVELEVAPKLKVWASAVPYNGRVLTGLVKSF